MDSSHDTVTHYMTQDNARPTWQAASELRRLISFVACVLVVARFVWPDVPIDGITLILLAAAVAPWLAPLIRSIELPGGVKLELHDLEKAEDRVLTAGLLDKEPTASPTQYSFQVVAPRDPNLALAGLRIEIEKRLATLAARADLVPNNRPLSVRRLLDVLSKAGILTQEERSVLLDLVDMLNAAVHGASVDAEASDWAFRIGPRLLASLESKMQ